jgi:hypothetical protein
METLHSSCRFRRNRNRPLITRNFDRLSLHQVALRNAKEGWSHGKAEVYGRVQSEYVEVPDSLLASTRELNKFFDRSYEYVSSLKPKPTTKKKRG